MISVLAACGQLGNGPPSLVSVNGVDVEQEAGEAYLPTGQQALGTAPNEVFALELDVSDPDGDDVLVWFPRAPAGLAFPPDALNGVWDVPDTWDGAPLELILEDVDPNDPRESRWFIPLWVAEDSGR